MEYLETSLEKGSLFETSQELGLKYVLEYNPDRFLACCEKALGFTPSAKNYGGWESREINGHMLGHYLSALSEFWRATKSAEAKEKLDYTVSRIKKLQRADGYFAGIPSTPFEKAFSGNFEVERFNLASWWVPWYSLHKIFAGLLDAFVAGGSADALAIVKKMADWAIGGTSKMSGEALQKMLYCEHGGMCKVFSDLYGITGEEKYLSEAKRWIHHEVIDSAIEGKDSLQGYHANTQIPKFIGIARLFELTGDERYKKAAEFFFDTVVNNRSYVIGGNSKGEHFGRLGEEVLARDTAETCNTYNMLELSEHIFSWKKSASVAEFYETALYNHILASQASDTGAKTYFVSLLPGTHKVYCTHDNAMWCCTGTGLENPARYNRFIAKCDGDVIFVNLFIASTFKTQDGWEIKISTNFPFSNTVRIKVLARGKNRKTLKVRAPKWNSTFLGEEDGYKDFGELKDATDITIFLSPALHARKARDSSGNFSIKYGAIVLAADLGSDGMECDTVDDHLSLMSEEAKSVKPILENIDDVSSWLKLTDAKTLTFSSKDFVFRPFFALHHSFYSVYFSAKKQSEGDKGVFEVIEVGRQQSEIEHNVVSLHTTIGYDEESDCSFRKFGESGFVEYSADLSDAKAIFITAFKSDMGSFTTKIGNSEEIFLPLSSSAKSGTIDIALSDSRLPSGLQKIRIEGTKGVRLCAVKIERQR